MCVRYVSLLVCGMIEMKTLAHTPTHTSGAQPNPTHTPPQELMSSTLPSRWRLSGHRRASDKFGTLVGLLMGRGGASCLLSRHFLQVLCRIRPLLRRCRLDTSLMLGSNFLFLRSLCRRLVWLGSLRRMSQNGARNTKI